MGGRLTVERLGSRSAEVDQLGKVPGKLLERCDKATEELLQGLRPFSSPAIRPNGHRQSKLDGLGVSFASCNLCVREGPNHQVADPGKTHSTLLQCSHVVQLPSLAPRKRSVAVLLPLVQ